MYGTNLQDGGEPHAVQNSVHSRAGGYCQLPKILKLSAYVDGNANLHLSY